MSARDGSGRASPALGLREGRGDPFTLLSRPPRPPWDEPLFWDCVCVVLFYSCVVPSPAKSYSLSFPSPNNRTR